MTQEQYERAAEIRYELSQLSPLQEKIGESDIFDLYFGTSVYCTHQGVRQAVREYITARIAELEKEFEGL